MRVDPGDAQTVGQWTGFYAALAGVAAALLGLLFVAISLRLNVFRDAQVADVRDFALLVFGQYLALVLLSLLALFPDADLATLGVAALVSGGLGLLWGIAITQQYRRLNTAPGTRARWVLSVAVVNVAAMTALLIAGGLLVRGDDAALRGLALATMALLVAASAETWVLLSHARAG